MVEKIKVVLDDGAYMPEYAHFGDDAGADIRTPKSFSIGSHSSVVIDTGIHVEIPKGCVGMLKSKSGLNVKNGILSEGVIDHGYTGSIKVKLYNHGDSLIRFNAGDKITQLVIIPFVVGGFEPANKIDGGKRADNGFGSTGR